MTLISRLQLLLTALAASLALFVLPAAAGAAEAEPNQVVVQFEDPATGAAPSAASADPVVLQVDNVRKALAELRARRRGLRRTEHDRPHCCRQLHAQ